MAPPRLRTLRVKIPPSRMAPAHAADFAEYFTSAVAPENSNTLAAFENFNALPTMK